MSKKAHLGDSFDGGFTWGSDQTQRYTMDGNYQFSDTAAGRLNLMSHESNVAGRESVDYDRWGVAPSLAFGLAPTPASTLTTTTWKATTRRIRVSRTPCRRQAKPLTAPRATRTSPTLAATAATSTA
ncbi:Catecholate siderophore receptor Fiu precursor [compost metagenome]